LADHPGLRQDQDGHHALLVQVGEQLMHLQDHELLVRHGVQVSAQAVDHDHPSAPVLDRVPHFAGELTGREIGGVDLLQAQSAVLNVRREIHADPGGSSEQHVPGLVKADHLGIGHGENVDLTCSKVFWKSVVSDARKKTVDVYGLISLGRTFRKKAAKRIFGCQKSPMRRWSYRVPFQASSPGHTCWPKCETGRHAAYTTASSAGARPWWRELRGDLDGTYCLADAPRKSM